MVGGQAYKTFLWGEQQVKEGKLTSNPYLNACALRFSRALNYSGMKVPSVPLLNGGKLTGEDKLNYMIRVRDVVKFVKTHLGKADYSQSPAPDVDLIHDPYLLAHKGILHFDISGWGDASGHITLWDGCDCGDSCYFMPSNATLKQVNFWELK